jgi:hypothetical protein
MTGRTKIRDRVARLMASQAFMLFLVSAGYTRGLAQVATPESRTDLAGPVNSGLRGETTISPPRLDASILVDGSLDEHVWQQALLLNGFSDYMPLDGRPAQDSTQVLIWYSPNALHLGIRAWEPHGAVHATFAQRDHIDADDFVQILLDTFREGRRAFIFAANPYGVQADGVRSEGDFGSDMPHSAFGSGRSTNVDLSPDFTFSSKGRLTTWGYEIEMAIPFASLRYSHGMQRWGFQVVRRVQHSGYQQSWTPARRASSSFLRQEGFLTNLVGLRRRLVLEAVPELTAQTDGARSEADSSRWNYRTRADLGGNVKWAVTSSTTLNATLRPDFSQVEADATQIAADLRFAISYPEKRPFFTDAIEDLETPNQLVYTRRITRPEVALRLTGRLRGTAVALLSALDQRDTLGRRALYHIARLRREGGTGTSTGLTITDRESGKDFSHLVAADYRRVVGLYTTSIQLGGSLTRRAGSSVTSPFYDVVVDRTGRRFGFRYEFNAVGNDFEAAAGFVPRVGFVRTMLANRVSPIISQTWLLERWDVRPTGVYTWLYRDFFGAHGALEQHTELENTFSFRGGWQVLLNPLVERFGFDPAAYAMYRVVSGGGMARDTSKFVIPGSRPAYGARVQIATPEFKSGAASIDVYGGRDVDFLEAGSVHRTVIRGTLDLRPTSQLRIAAAYQHDEMRRWNNGSLAYQLHIPWVKFEYQLTPSVFFRSVAQYQILKRDSVRDWRTGLPVIGYDGAQDPAASSSALRHDLLLSYQPSPGKVFFVGYGGYFAARPAPEIRSLRRTSDRLFIKLSYPLHPRARQQSAQS